MSKDWTPCELYHADKFAVSQGWPSYRTLSPTIFDTETGEQVPVISQAEMEARKPFKEISFLFSDWYVLYMSIDAKIRDEVFHYVDDILVQVINDYELNLHPSVSKHYQIIKKWYLGKLDPGFYYNNRNNEALSHFILWLVDNKEYRQKEKPT